MQYIQPKKTLQYSNKDTVNSELEPHSYKELLHFVSRKKKDAAFWRKNPVDVMAFLTFWHCPAKVAFDGISHHILRVASKIMVLLPGGKLPL